MNEFHSKAGQETYPGVEQCEVLDTDVPSAVGDACRAAHEGFAASGPNSVSEPADKVTANQDRMLHCLRCPEHTMSCSCTKIIGHLTITFIMNFDLPSQPKFCHYPSIPLDSWCVAEH